jgi:hypothetical protein
VWRRRGWSRGELDLHGTLELRLLRRCSRGHLALKNREVEEAHGGGGRSSKPDLFLEKILLYGETIIFFRL